MARGPKRSGLQGIALWAPVTALLTLGLLTTVIDLSHIGAKEGKRAQANEQRFVVNAASGEVLLGNGDAEKPKTPEIEAAPEAVVEEPAAVDPAAAEAAPQPPVPETPAAEASEAAKTEHAPPAEAASVADEAGAAPVTPVSGDEASEPVQVKLAEGTPSLRTAPLTTALNAPQHGKDSLVPAPAPEVSETVDGATLPIRGKNNVIPSKIYAQPFKRKEEQATISFVVLNAGLDPQSLGLILGMPKEISVAYSPYVHGNENYSEHLRAAGHEVWTMLPSMSDRYPSDDPGPLGIIGHMPPEEIIRRMHAMFAVIPGSVGLVLPPNEAVTLQKDTITPLLNELSSRGLLLLSTHPTRNIDQITKNAALAEIIRRSDLVLDPAPNEAQIKSKLAGVLDTAKEKGSYVVVLSARPQSLELLRDWLKETKLEEAQFALAPLSLIYQPKTAPEPYVSSEPQAKPDKSKPKPQGNKKPKVLPQDQYRTPAGKDSKPASGGHH